MDCLHCAGPLRSLGRIGREEHYECVWCLTRFVKKDQLIEELDDANELYVDIGGEG